MSIRHLVSRFYFKFINEDPSGVTIEPLSGGLMNYCFRVSSSDHKHSVVLKHTEETAKVYFYYNFFFFLRACSLDFQAAHTHSGSTAGFGVCEYVVWGYVLLLGLMWSYAWVYDLDRHLVPTHLPREGFFYFPHYIDIV